MDDLGTLAQLNWYPGHMAKAKRIIMENLKLVDVVIELLDARIPRSSANPILKDLIGTKPHLIALNKIDLADSAVNGKWEEYFSSLGKPVVKINSLNGKGIRQLVTKADELAKAKTAKFASKGAKPRNARVMIVGIPNVGKSSLINRLSGSASLKTADKPGVTRAKQWIKIKNNLDLLDTPGILWPKFEDPEVGLNLAFTGAISDEVYDIEQAAQLAATLAERQRRHDIVVVAHALLRLQLEGEQDVVGKLNVADAGEGQLMLEVQAVEHAAYGVAHNQRHVAARQHAAVEHGLQREAAAERERHAPQEVKDADARTPFPAYEVVGIVTETSLQSRATGGEKPVVF